MSDDEQKYKVGCFLIQPDTEIHLPDDCCLLGIETITIIDLDPMARLWYGNKVKEGENDD